VKFSELVFSVTFAGSFSRSAVNYNAGAQTAVSNIVMATAVLVTLLFLMPLFYYTPNVILGAIIISAVIGLIDYQAAYCLWKVDKLDFLACLCSFFGVLFISVPLGLGIAVSLQSLTFILMFNILFRCLTPLLEFRLEFQYSKFSCMSPVQTP
jgi:MFS superfamily sulfate permease-like transporter